MKNYHRRNISCRTLFQFFMYSSAGYMDFRKYKKQIKGDKDIAKELQDGNKPNKRTDSKNQ